MHAIAGRSGRVYKGYALALMTIAVGLSQLDRGLMTMLLQSIKLDMHLSDTQIGLVNGLAFALLYSTLAIPFARWADRGNRAAIASLAIVIWGLALVTSSLVTNFVQLLFVRMAAAIGEAGVPPPMYSLLGDHFPEPAARTRAMYVYSAGGVIAGVMSLMLGGWLNDRYGWRMVFLLVGVPAFVVALMVKQTLAEPRTSLPRGRTRASSFPSIKEVWCLLWRQRTCRHLTIGLMLLWIVVSGLGPWYAAFMMRSHGMGGGEMGFWMGAGAGLSAFVGLLCGGFVVNRWFKANERGQLRLVALAAAGVTPSYVGFLLLPNKYAAIAALMPATVVISAFVPSVYVLLQRLVPDEMRATSMTVVLFLANLVGISLGPQLVGILSDALSRAFGAESLRYAMLLVSWVALWSAFHIWRSGRTVNVDLSANADRARTSARAPGPQVQAMA